MSEDYTAKDYAADAHAAQRSSTAHGNVIQGVDLGGYSRGPASGAGPSPIEVEVVVGVNTFRFAGPGPFSAELRQAFKDWLAAVTGKDAALDKIADTIDANTARLAAARDESEIDSTT